jgi:hypothetical protein
MIKLTSAMTLLYLGQHVADGFTSDTFLQGQPISLRDNYTPITQIPLAEMEFGGTPVELIEEVIALTAGTDWRRQGRRPIMRGDIICRGADPWVVLKRDEITITNTSNAVLPLRLWPNYAIYYLDSVDMELKEMTF